MIKAVGRKTKINKQTKKTIHYSPTSEKRKKRHKRKNKTAIHQSTPWQTEKNETNTPQKDRQCPKKYMQKRRIYHLSTLSVSPLSVKSGRKINKPERPVIYTHPYSYHRDWLSSGLSDWSELFT